MKKVLLLLPFAIISFSGFSQDCFLRLQKAFDERGAYSVADDMHRNVYVSFFEEDGSVCYKGKTRVEDGFITSVFLQFDDNTYELMEKRFYNAKKQKPIIVNGITEMIQTADGERFKIVFIESLKPKKKSYKQVELPDDL